MLARFCRFDFAHTRMEDEMMRTTNEIFDRQTMLRSGKVSIESFPMEECDDKSREFMLKASMEFDNHKVKSALKVYEWYFANGGIRTEQEVRTQLALLETKILQNRQNIETANFFVKAKLLLNQIGYQVARQETLWVLGE